MLSGFTFTFAQEEGKGALPESPVHYDGDIDNTGFLRMKAHANDPVYLQMQAEERWDVIPGAESHAALNARLMRALGRIHRAHPDQLVAAVVHGGVIGHILAHATGARPFAFNGADNGSISHIVMLGERIMVRRFNDSTHLQSDMTVAAGGMT